ncbi:BofC C-terminal domain-containing protein [Paenibacillus sp. GCM10027628]|uniref:BofC C-terminal domain-containing protein n=1 Tax=Paenibacillus sp. GCM10027628 TaxID=3273413 RepID=UPI003643F524
MNVQSFLKHLKRKLRWKRNWIALGTFIIVCATGWGLYATGQLPGATSSLEKASKATFGKLTPEEDRKFNEAITTLKGITDSRQTYLLKSYLCGEERQELGIQTPNQLLEEQMKHPGWKLSLGVKGDITFIEEIEDLSPECKLKAVFGIDEAGNLSLFNGTPGKDNVIRTFFQLNIQHLESSLPVETVKQLHQGIRVSDMEEYNSVLSTFSDYAVEESERAMMRP